jgi:hypothetical protein
VKKPYLFFSCTSDKDVFLRTARLMPLPLKKVYQDEGNSWDEAKLVYDPPAIYLCVSVYRSSVCTLVEPAKPAVYHCEPMFSSEEEAALDSAPEGSLAAVAPGFVTP